MLEVRQMPKSEPRKDIPRKAQWTVIMMNRVSSRRFWLLVSTKKRMRTTMPTANTRRPRNRPVIRKMY